MTETTGAFVYHSWLDFLEAVKVGEVRFEEGAYARVVYDSVYSDDAVTIEGEVQSASDSLGRPFRLEDRRVQGWHVEKDGRDLGRVETIAWEPAE